MIFIKDQSVILSVTELINSLTLPGAIKMFSKIIFIDAQVQDYQSLISGVIPEAIVVVLDATQDGIQQITQCLVRHPFSEIHIISHGAPGCLFLGNRQLNLDTLNQYADQLSSWSADSILLYGCNVAAGDAGAEFIEKLHQRTGAEIAASTTKIGHISQGGNWELDVRIGELKTDIAILPSAQKTYSGILANPVANNDSVVGNVRQQFSFDVTTNDTDADGNGTIDPSSIQLIDPNTGNPAAGNTVTIAGEGTYSFDTTTNRVVFDPESKFSGVTSVNYTVNDQDGNTSNPATITAQVLHPCEQIDVWFGNDESGSVDDTEFAQSRVLMAGVAERLRFGNDGANAALFTWADTGDQAAELALTGDQTQFVNDVSNYARNTSGGTDMKSA